MLEKALKGTPRYYLWIGFLLVVMGLASGAYVVQLMNGLTITGMSRDVTWGFYISQFTYLVGLAASGVMIVLPYYFHHYKKFKDLVIFGEFMAIAAIVMCMGFIVVDLGQPQRMLNVMLFPTPHSMLFWDMIVLCGYLILNILVGWTCLECDRQHLPHPKWTKVLAYVSIIWAFSIHTVTAFLYQGLPGRHYWLTAILAARFLASAFCSGPAILLLVILITEKVTTFKAEVEGVATLAKIITYAMCVNVFFFLCEVFTAFYSNIPGHMNSLTYLFSGLEGHTELVGFMWTAAVFGLGSLALLIPPKLRDNRSLLPWSLVILVIATWIDKGLALLIGGFNPTPFETISPYWPTGKELAVALMIYSLGALVVTVLFKVATEIKREIGASQKPAPSETEA
jgi:molybdopterin-containing oxidoreductase family membrane subunit